MQLLCDTMCGKLARYLRMAGHDVAYALDRGVEADEAVAELALDEDRRLITRDAALAARVDDTVLLTGLEIEDQLREVREAGIPIDLADDPTRCGRCNGPLKPVSSDANSPDYVPNSAEIPTFRCRDCGQYFWKGSHWENVRKRIDAI